MSKVDSILADLAGMDLREIPKHATHFTGVGCVIPSTDFFQHVLLRCTSFYGITFTCTPSAALAKCTRLIVGERGSFSVAKAYIPEVKFLRGLHAKVYFVDRAVWVGSYNLTKPTLADLMSLVTEERDKTQLKKWFEQLWKQK